jgi:hypothetical protein
MPWSPPQSLEPSREPGVWLFSFLLVITILFLLSFSPLVECITSEQIDCFQISFLFSMVRNQNGYAHSFNF